MLEKQKKLYDRSKKESLEGMGDGQSITLYTFDQEILYNEFLESYNAGERLQYELKHGLKNNKLNSTKKTSTSTSSATSSSSSSSNTNKSKKDIKSNNTSPNEINKNNKKESSTLKQRSNASSSSASSSSKKSEKIEKKKVKDWKKEENKKENAVVHKLKSITKTRTFQAIENSILFIIIFICVRYYSSILYSINSFFTSALSSLWK